jgi:hypothetical protein
MQYAMVLSMTRIASNQAYEFIIPEMPSPGSREHWNGHDFRCLCVYVCGPGLLLESPEFRLVFLTLTTGEHLLLALLLRAVPPSPWPPCCVCLGWASFPSRVWCFEFSISFSSKTFFLLEFGLRPVHFCCGVWGW